MKLKINDYNFLKKVINESDLSKISFEEVKQLDDLTETLANKIRDEFYSKYKFKADERNMPILNRAQQDEYVKFTNEMIDLDDSHKENTLKVLNAYEDKLKASNASYAIVKELKNILNNL